MNVGVFGSSLPTEGERAYEEAREIGRGVAQGRARVICGGYGGVMEAACRGAVEAGGTATGVVLAGREAANRWVTDMVVVPDLPERLRRLRDLPDVWVFLSHGLGTLLELVWIAESIVKGDTPPRPFVLLGDFWRPVVETAISEASAPSGAAKLASSVRFVRAPAEAVAAALGTRID